MKTRAKWLNDILLSTKPGRHQDKRKKQKHREETDEMRSVRDYRHRKNNLKNEEGLD